MTGSTPLNDSQNELFAQLMAEGTLNQTDAYMQSGFTGKRRSATTGASVLLTNPDIKERIQYLQQQAAQKAVVTVQMALERLAIEMAGTGPDTSSAARTKAAELALKYHGAFTERTEQTGTVTIRVIRE
jgi:phage terminase small subunit